MILRRLEGERFSEVLPRWRGETAVLIAGGPSLTMEQVRLVALAHEAGAVKCIAVNDAYLVASWADAHYAADAHWHRWHTEGIAKPILGLSAVEVRNLWATFAGEKCTVEASGSTVEDERVHMLRNKDFPRHGFGLSTDPRALITGRNSGFQALNLATLAGARRVILLGYDGQPGWGKSHWHGTHPRPTPEGAYPYYREAMQVARADLEAAGVEVLNASPGSAIDAFPCVDLEEALP